MDLYELKVVLRGNRCCTSTSGQLQDRNIKKFNTSRMAFLRASLNITQF